MQSRDGGKLLALFLLGIVLTFAIEQLLGRTMAIAAPAAFFEWFRANGALSVGLFLWDLAVVTGPAAGVIVFVVSLIALQKSPSLGWAAPLAVVTGVFVGAYLVAPLWHGQGFSRVTGLIRKAWWAYSFEAAVILAALAASAFSRSRGPRGVSTGSAL